MKFTVFRDINKKLVEKIFAESLNKYFRQSIKCQCCSYIETSQMIYTANRLSIDWFLYETTLALNGLTLRTAIF